MSIGIEQTKKIASLARIALDEKEEAAYSKGLSSIVGWIEKLGAVDTSGVEPQSNVADLDTPTLRKDAVTDGGKQADILANAPETVGGFFVVQKIVE